MKSSQENLENPKSISRSNRGFSVTIPVIVVLFLTSVSGAVHGLLDGRWNKSVDSIAQGKKLENLPEQIGGWVLTEKKELNEKASQLLRVHGSVVRTYYNQSLDTEVTVAVLYGPRGPIAVHTPEICYKSVGTKLIGKRRAVELGNDELWSTRFGSEENGKPKFEVWYGWSDGGNWIAAEAPRFWMTDNLYKIQLAGPVGSSFSPNEKFLAEFLPQLASLIQ